MDAQPALTCEFLLLRHFCASIVLIIDIITLAVDRVKTGDIILLKNQGGNYRPAKVFQKMTEVDGKKDGYSNVTLDAKDIFTGDTLKVEKESSKEVNVPDVERSSYRLERIEDNRLVLSSSSETITLPMPSGHLGNTIQEKFTPDANLLVTVLSVKGFSEQGVGGVQVQ
ncbi:Eukaryotic translation initiation factor 5A [Tulasnella sp. 419]|nr:Eukaryotic translation initiation factor 5A [Tulasnella sp. 419]